MAVAVADCAVTRRANVSLASEIRAELSLAKQAGLYRSLRTIDGRLPGRLRLGPGRRGDRRELLDFSSNDYLGLSVHPRVTRAAARAASEWGAGSGASRLISGNLGIHETLERELARAKGEAAATVFSSGYLANLGAVTSFVDERDLVLVDRLNHASLIDAARLSRAKLQVYPHRDVARLDAILSRAQGFRRTLVLTDSYFSMDGTVAPLDALVKTCRRHGAWLLVDEAHATGVFGEKGGGLTERFGVTGKIDLVMGTLSKALGSSGGFIAGVREVREQLVNRSRPFIFTTAPNPPASAAALESLRIIRSAPGLRKKLWSNVTHARNVLKKAGFDLSGSEGPIVPIVAGESRKTLALRDFLMKEGVFAPAIRPPSVPKGTDRVRVTITAAHEPRDIEKLCAVLAAAKRRIL